MSTRTKTLQIRVTEEEYNAIVKLAEYLELPPSTMARNMLLTAKDDAEFLKFIGVLKGTKKYYDFKKKWENLARNLNNEAKTAEST